MVKCYFVLVLAIAEAFSEMMSKGEKKLHFVIRFFMSCWLVSIAHMQ